MVEQVLHEAALAGAAEAAHAVLHVGDEALACLLPVVADVDARLDLSGDDGCRRLAHGVGEGDGVDVLAPTAAAVELGEGARAAAGSRRG